MQVSREFSNIQACYDTIHSEVEMAEDLLNNFYQKASSDLGKLVEDINEHIVNIKFFANMQFPPIKKNLKEAKIRWDTKKEISEYSTLVDRLTCNLKIFSTAKQLSLDPTLDVPSNVTVNATSIHLNNVHPSTTPCSKLSNSTKSSKKTDEANETTMEYTFQPMEPEVEPEDWQAIDDEEEDDDDEWCVIKTDQ